MAHTTAIDPVILVGLLLSIISFVGGLIEWIAMRRVPHPIAARRGRTRGRVTGDKRLARCGRRRRGICGCGLPHLCLLSCGRRLNPAHLINPVMK